MSDGERALRPVAARIAVEAVGEPVPEVLSQYIMEILETQRELLVLEQRVADTRLTFEGYRSQRQLDRLARQYNASSRHVEQISESLLTCRLGDVEGVDAPALPTDEALIAAIVSGSIPKHVGRLERISARVNQQLIAKQGASTTRMVAVMSVIATLIALASLGVAVVAAGP